MVTAREVREVVEDRPELEAAVREVLNADEPFEFDDLDLNSGEFGEIVSAGIAVQSSGGQGYHVADREAVERGIPSQGPHDSPSERDTPGSDQIPGGGIGSISAILREKLPMPTLAQLANPSVGLLVCSLFFVALLRTVFSYGSVFRGDRIVLSGNDPYYYRYWIENLLVSPDSGSSLPASLTNGEPLFVATAWLGTVLLGGTRDAAGLVLAWYPVVSAIISGVLLYFLTTKVMEDRRVGLSAVLLFGLIPGHALRTSLGFGDHHAFDYPWLILTAFAIAVILTVGQTQSRRSWLGAVVLGLGVAGQTMAWEAGPLLTLPIGVIVVGLAVLWVRNETSPLGAGIPIIAGLGLAAILTVSVHVSLGWHSGVTVATPVLLLVGSTVVLLIGEASLRGGLDTRRSLGLGIGALVVGIVSIAVLLPVSWKEVMARVEGDLFRSDAIAEASSLFGDSGGWLLLFGFVLLLAVPYLVWASWRRIDKPRWLVPVVYGWWFFILSAIQVRFVGEFSVFAAVFAGLGFVHLAERIDVARLPKPFAESIDGRRLTLPDRNSIIALVLLFLLVGGLGFVQIPVKTSQVTVPDDQYRTAAWMADYNDQREWEYPENYVFSRWGENRLYNYFVNGESSSFGFAQANYGTFLHTDDPTAWYERLRNRAGFIVYRSGTAPNATLVSRLESYGSRVGSSSGLSHFRAVFAANGGTYRVFTLVPGALLTGPTSGGDIQTETSVEIPGASFQYERSVSVTHGVYQLRVPYPGTYRIEGENVTVSEQAVREGTLIEEFDRSGVASWTFDEGAGQWAYDRSGGFHARTINSSWTDGRNGSAVALDPANGSVVRTERFSGPERAFTVDMWIKPTALDTNAAKNYRHLLRMGANASLVLEESGAISFRIPGVNSSLWAAGSVPTGEWSRVTAIYDGGRRQLYLNGEKVGEQQIGTGRVEWGNFVSIGSARTQKHTFAGAIDEVRIFDGVRVP